ncbi:hypothetical protein NDA14_004420 [Ustilago hordei]|uniref:Uncharacterized protein n=1 Tax=Ustilago hordei TaxID=120017 RepID=I2G1W1_USTHO|nr:uncharacterized protein UHO2_02337 [Ustilago hordei]KAJ1039981.1 hypothetical protein NDA10_003095 [Ustilago hordei]KAJ1585549.1 hypothetical protein NDA15_007279 [Ustilago hordei]KAJ1587929.1 hypothetical protein NDA12_002096 [Ustilago hordei]KAJ1601596.1 hypothetical protein NDA14_004420 [Ustilago hordei]CCF53154.1 uncharacterized protein UHOR_15817 [Ustilago hordei]
MSDTTAESSSDFQQVPTSLAPSKPPAASTNTNEASAHGKNRFSLDALRIPFVSSPRKASVTTWISKADSDHLQDAGPAVLTTTANLSEPKPVSGTHPSPITDAPIAATTTTSTEHDSPATQQLAPPNELRPKPSSLASAQRPSRTTSPHRVSFSPSTEEVADLREQSLAFATLGQNAETKADRVDEERHPQHPSKSKAKGKSKAKTSKWRAFKSKSTSDLTNTSRRVSMDSTLTVSSAASSSTSERFEDRAALPGAAAAKRRLFRWDRKGIHHSGVSDKGKVAKVKVTKHQALAARHAKTLEQVINAGMGLHPVLPPSSSAAAAQQVTAKGGNKANVPRAKPIPVVDRSQLRGLKSALLDVDLANNIISELRNMPVPLDALRSGLGKIVPDVHIGTAGEHGEERILVASLPDAALEGNDSKDDSEIRKRPGATPEALGPAAAAASTARERPPLGRKAKSAAEEALRKITLQAEASAPPQKALVTARTSSLPPFADDRCASAASSPIPAQSTPVTKAATGASGARPLKMVCLDCDEREAHQRHAQHLDAATVVTSEANTNSADGNGAFGVASIATGAAAALAGVGGLLATRSAVTSPDEPSAAAVKNVSSSARRPMLKSLSMANLPTLQDGQRLMGSTPLQLLMDPVGTAAQNSGAFDVLANVSGAAIRATQDMDSIHPPLDRMAIFIHWWGFEITLPKASIAYLGTAHSVSGAFLSFLQTMAVGGGVPELLPFIKYISMFMEVEYKAIQAQDQGHGVCIAGTWFMPLALVPRPWDYPLDGPSAETPAQGTKSFSAMPAAMADVEPAIAPSLVSLTDPAGAPKRHVFKKKQSVVAEASIAQVAVLGNSPPPQQPVPPKRNLSPSQMAAIQAARTEKIPHDLSPRHSRASSIASAKSGKVLADLNHTTNAPITGVQIEAALASVQELPEIGSLRIKA